MFFRILLSIVVCFFVLLLFVFEVINYEVIVVEVLRLVLSWNFLVEDVVVLLKKYVVYFVVNL